MAATMAVSGRHRSASSCLRYGLSVAAGLSGTCRATSRYRPWFSRYIGGTEVVTSGRLPCTTASASLVPSPTTWKVLLSRSAITPATRGWGLASSSSR